MNKEHKKNILLYILLGVLVAGVLFSAWKLFGILYEYHKAATEFHDMSDSFKVAPREENDMDEHAPEASPLPEAGAEEEDFDDPFLSVDMKCPFSVLFEEMWETTRDVAAWICSYGTAIDYAVMHGETNDTYLHANWKGNYSYAGSIFTNYRCSGLLDDFNTIIYGHNMKDGSMFHSIKSYSSQSYYEEHPYIWYATPEANYILYLVAGMVVKTSDDVYSYLTSEEEVREVLKDAMDASDFTPDWTVPALETGELLDADAVVEQAERMVVLSTCSYEFDNARYVLVGVPLRTK